MRTAALGMISLSLIAAAARFAAGQATGPAADSPAGAQGGEGPRRPWYQAGFPHSRRPLPDADKLPVIRVDGNKFVDPDGKTILLRGVSISDPDKVDGQGHWNKAHFEHVKELGARLVRIPIHPVAWRERTPEKYIELLEQAVEWCTELELYVIIDWHSIGNLETELFENPMYDTTKRETFEFWRTIARRFAGNNTVAFYELFNEPTTFRGQLGPGRWGDWKRTNEDLIELIRAYDQETIPLVAGFDWAYDLTPLIEDPLDASGIGYVVHPYESKRPAPWQPKWEENFGFAAAKYPIVATEFGFAVRPGETIGPDDYGNAIVGYLEAKGISWTAWCYDPEWGPPLLKNWDYELTVSGEFVKKKMQAR